MKILQDWYLVEWAILIKKNSTWQVGMFHFSIHTSLWLILFTVKGRRRLDINLRRRELVFGNLRHCAHTDKSTPTFDVTKTVPSLN
ncbi:hypothetical protein BDR04DRAFT_862038 [Suillus decipiens]|nr:hypothetical protein BDR04DRAFT_862038 [Suillus decipiens]